MDNLAWVVAGVLAVAGAISTLGGAANWIVKLVQVLKAPNAEQDKRLASLEKHMEEVDGYLATDKKRLDNIDESTRVTQRALLALLAHGMVFSALNLIYALFQDRITFPKIFSDYHIYRTRVPFLLPTSNSVRLARDSWPRKDSKEDES